MIQIYHGDGKGKTTAAVGISVRARGACIPVIFVQFLKDGSSREIEMLKKLGVKIMLADTFFGFVHSMDAVQRQQTREAYAVLLRAIEAECMTMCEEWQRDISGGKGQENCGVSCVLILDEIIHACNSGLVDEIKLIEFLLRVKDDVEVVLTGRSPSKELIACADYCTCFTKEKHPFDKGVTARMGIER